MAPFSPFVDVYGPTATGVPTAATEAGIIPIAPIQNLPQFPGGPYAGTRVVTVPKMIVYNGAALSLFTTTGGALNLSDDTATGTLTGTWTAGIAACPSPSTA